MRRNLRNMNLSNGGNFANSEAGVRQLPVKKRRLPLLLRWGRMLELCQEAGISSYAVREAVKAGQIRQTHPPKPWKGCKSSRAFYVTSQVQGWIAEVTGEGGEI